jgi:hypothetical protein
VGKRLLECSNLAQEYMNGKSSLGQFQQLCRELMRQEYALLSGSSMGELVKYVLAFCG